jgi:hypothetical protein
LVIAGAQVEASHKVQSCWEMFDIGSCNMTTPMHYVKITALLWLLCLPLGIVALVAARSSSAHRTALTWTAAISLVALPILGLTLFGLWFNAA